MSRLLTAYGRSKFLSAGVLLFSLQGISAQAEYIDPIDLPAIEMASAKQSLLLDIVQIDNRLVTVGERGHILYSDDQGLNWVQANVSTRSQINALTFLDNKIGWAVGEDQVVIFTTDGGKNWQLKQDGRNSDQRGPLLDLAFQNGHKGFAVGVFNKMLHTTDGGDTWEPWQDHVDNEDEWHFFSIATVGEHNIYITSEMGLMFRSLNGGESFEPVQTDHDGTFHGILARQADDGRDQLVLFGVGGVMYTSLDGGESWNYLDSGIKTGLAGGTWLEDGSALIVGADGVVIKLENNLTELQLTTITNGLPLNSVSSTQDQVTLVGLGGIQTYSLQQLLDRR